MAPIRGNRWLGVSRPSLAKSGLRQIKSGKSITAEALIRMRYLISDRLRWLPEGTSNLVRQERKKQVTRSSVRLGCRSHRAR